MRDRFFLSLAAGMAGALFLAMATLAVPAPHAAFTPTAPAASGPTGPTVYRQIVISLDPQTGLFSFNVATLQVPLHARVVFTIVNFDPSWAPVPTSSDTSVQGTMGGTMGMGATGQQVTVGAIASPDLSHTFSMSDRFYHLNVPIPRAPSSGGPMVVTFSKVFDFPGTFEWGCIVWCGQPDMQSPHPMYGSLVVS